MSETKVFHMERLKGVDPRIFDFFLWWSASGPFALTIPPTGGVRTAEKVQTDLWNQGRSTPGPMAGEDGYGPLGLTITQAKTLADTPHGRGGAADALVAVVKDGKVIAVEVDCRKPKVRLMYEAFGLLVEQNGLDWGGRFKGKDMPHCQVKNWRDLPMPSINVA